MTAARAGEFTRGQKVATGGRNHHLPAGLEFSNPARRRRCLCFGTFGDQNSFFLLSPPPSSDIRAEQRAWRYWDPDIRWYRATNGGRSRRRGSRWRATRRTAAGSPEAEGGSDIAPFHGLADRVPQEVEAELDTLRASIMDGSFEGAPRRVNAARVLSPNYDRGPDGGTRPDAPLRFRHACRWTGWFST